MRKRIIIILSVLILLTAGILAYFIFFTDTKLPAPLTQFRFPATPSRQTATTGQSSDGRLIKISQFVTIAPTLNQTGNRVRFFEKTTGSLYEAGFDGTDIQKVSDGLLTQNIADIVWSPRHDQFGALLSDSTQNFIYNFSTSRSSYFTNKEVISIGFAPSGNQIVYQQKSRTDSSIVIANSNNTAPRTIFTAALPRLNLAWLSNNLISAVSAPSGLANSLFMTINQNGAINTAGPKDLKGLTVLWAPNAQNLIFSHTRGTSDVVLELSNANFNQREELNIKTLSDKCVWTSDSKTIYCAAPESWNSNAILPDDYYKGLLDQENYFVKIDALTSIVNTIGQYPNIDAEQLLITPQDDYLLFINRKDGLLYSLKL